MPVTIHFFAPLCKRDPKPKSRKIRKSLVCQTNATKCEWLLFPCPNGWPCIYFPLPFWLFAKPAFCLSPPCVLSLGKAHKKACQGLHKTLPDSQMGQLREPGSRPACRIRSRTTILLSSSPGAQLLPPPWSKDICPPHTFWESTLGPSRSRLS